MPKKHVFQKGLLEWINFEENDVRINYREFPWRNSKDPYKILVSEILLQKTNAEKVEKIYDIFFKKYPVISNLIEGCRDELINLLKPLGLQFKKSERLIQISKNITNDFNSEIPNNYHLLINLKGIGNYIANAVLCFAFGKKKAIVDSNIIRIYERIFNLKSKNKRPRTDKKIWEFADKFLPLENFQLYNYALLDFGAQLCKAKNPLCLKCFYKGKCSYYKEFKK